MPRIISTPNNTDQSSVSENDTNRDFLENKLVAGANVTITKLNPGANETLSISSTGGGGDQNVDGGNASSVYTAPQNIDGGSA